MHLFLEEMQLWDGPFLELREMRCHEIGRAFTQFPTVTTAAHSHRPSLVPRPACALALRSGRFFPGSGAFAQIHFNLKEPFVRADSWGDRISVSLYGLTLSRCQGTGIQEKIKSANKDRTSNIPMAVLPILVAVLMLMDSIASAPTPLSPRTKEQSEKDMVRLSDAD